MIFSQICSGRSRSRNPSKAILVGGRAGIRIRLCVSSVAIPATSGSVKESPPEETRLGLKREWGSVGIVTLGRGRLPIYPSLGDSPLKREGGEERASRRLSATFRDIEEPMRSRINSLDFVGTMGAAVRPPSLRSPHGNPFLNGLPAQKGVCGIHVDLIFFLFSFSNVKVRYISGPGWSVETGFCESDGQIWMVQFL